jgi:hypothetical protein
MSMMRNMRNMAFISDTCSSWHAPHAQPLWLGSIMNYRRQFRKWFAGSKEALALHCTSIFGVKQQNKEILTGTGFVVRFKGLTCIMTCDHVIRPLKEPIYTLPFDGRPQTHEGKRYKSAVHDLGFFFPNTGTYLENKIAIDATDAVLTAIPAGESVLVYGYPSGNISIQQGAVLSEGNKLNFTSMTYLSVTEADKKNSSLFGYSQPTVRWIQGEFMHERLTKIEHHLVAQGFSGGPVF